MIRPTRSSSAPLRALARLPILALAGSLLAAPASAQAVLETWDGHGINDLFGDALANAGDVDGDGVDDLIIGSPNEQAGRGRVRIVSGRTGDPILEVIGSPGDRLGTAVTGMGDMNGDGISEVAYSAPGSSLFQSGQTLYDRVTIRDIAAGSNYYTYWSTVNEDAGASLAGGGDGDGDGIPDLLIGAPLFDAPSLTDCGRVLRVRVTSVSVQIIEVARGDQAGQQTGHSVAWLGDVVGNGKDYLAVGAPYRFESGSIAVGRVYVSDGFGNPLWSKPGPSQTNGRFGWSLAGGVDLTDNGLPDVVIGAPYYDSSGLTDRGRVVVYRGHSGAFYASRLGDSAGDQMGYDVEPVIVAGAPHVLAGAPGDGETGGLTLFDRGVLHRLTGFSLATTWTAQGGGWAHFGRAIAVLSDMNGDGSNEFAVGHPYPNFFESSVPGRVSLYDGETHLATSSNYGAGLAGTFGVPSLAMVGPPKLGTTSQLFVSSSLFAPTMGVLIIGIQTAALPFKMGTLHVQPLLLSDLPNIPAAGLSLTSQHLDDHTFSGVSVYLQVAELDPGSPSGVSLSPGLQITYGV